MANEALNILAVEADWKKLSPFIRRTRMQGQKAFDGSWLPKENYMPGDMIKVDENFSKEGLPKIWNAVKKGIEVDWRALAEIAEKRDDGIRIFYTANIELAKFEWGDAIVITFDSAWGAPQVLLDWLNEKDLDWQLCCVEDGCGVLQDEGTVDFGLKIIEVTDEEDDSTFHDIEFSKDLAEAVQKGREYESWS